MSFQDIAVIGTQWLWEQYGKAISDKALDTLKTQWRKFQWGDAESKYRARMRELHSTSRILGYPTPIYVENTYIDVYVFDKPTAFKRYDIAELQAKPLERETLHVEYVEYTRKPALIAVEQTARLFLLGRPGAGKTTFLKFLTLQACLGKLNKTPIYISLKELSDSKMELIEFIVEQFDICQFPDAKAFVLRLLKEGNALVMFDGLDEVGNENKQRAEIITELVNFSKRYPTSTICISCRTAATEYTFERFEYLEIAEFDEQQVYQFAAKWYQHDDKKLGRLIIELEKPEHQGLFELANTPLLLALLCLVFDEIGYFPSRRVDLYKEALDALLRKWDSSRGIQRDEIYRKLSIGRKEQLLSRIAAQNFETGKYFFGQDALTFEISHFIEQLPPVDIGENLPDGEIILKAIEAQHGILVERAHNIYSFSHLTFQEYFTARYIVDNSANGTYERLIKSHLSDSRWHEVFLLVASLQPEADVFFKTFLDGLDNFVQNDIGCNALLNWVNEKAVKSKWPGPGSRGLLLLTAVDYQCRRKQVDKLSLSLNSLRRHIFHLATELTYDNTAIALGISPLYARNRIQHFDFHLDNISDFS